MDSCNHDRILDVVYMNHELHDLIAAKLDVMEFLDILGLELEDILDKFNEEIDENREDLLAACR